MTRNKIGRMKGGWYAAYKNDYMNWWVYRNTRYDKYGVCHVIPVSKNRAIKLNKEDAIHV